MKIQLKSVTGSIPGDHTLDIDQTNRESTEKVLKRLAIVGMGKDTFVGVYEEYEGEKYLHGATEWICEVGANQAGGKIVGVQVVVSAVIPYRMASSFPTMKLHDVGYVITGDNLPQDLRERIGKGYLNAIDPPKIQALPTAQ